MSNKRISQLDPVLQPSNSDFFAIVNQNETKKISYGTLKSVIAPSGTGGSGLGWARYDDNQYTSSNKLSVTAGSSTALPNNAATVYNTYINSSKAFYVDGVTPKLQVENEGDVYILTVVFHYSAANANQAYGNIALTSTGATPYERVTKDFYFGKGNNTTHHFHEVFQYYADTDFVTNGNQITISAYNQPIQVWDIIYFIQRTQNHA